MPGGFGSEGALLRRAHLAWRLPSLQAPSAQHVLTVLESSHVLLCFCVKGGSKRGSESLPPGPRAEWVR